MPLQETTGNISADAYAGGVAAVPNYIESCFSTYLYTGTGAAQTITNGIDLAGKGGLVWTKPRDRATSHTLFDTLRGTGKILYSDATVAQSTDTNSLTAFNSNGFSLGVSGQSNASPYNFVSWTFRKQPKFFDVVTWSGDGATPRNIAHSLGSVPGCIIVKCTSTVTDWAVYHQSIGNDYRLKLNVTDAQQATGNTWANTTPTSTVFTVGNNGAVNDPGQTYVAYLFAHNAGGFGLTGTDNVISCGSFTTDGSGNFSVNLGYEPQFVMYKGVAGGAWIMLDTMRGMSLASGADAYLQAQSSAAEATSSVISPTATGFQNDPTGFNASLTYIYIAIRRGPMKVPTDGTKVFKPSAVSADNTTISTGFPVDLALGNLRTGTAANTTSLDRLRGSDRMLVTSATSAESSSGSGNYVFDDNTGYQPDFFLTGSIIWYAMRRAPGFFDEVCYTGDATMNRALSHNLAVSPELIIAKSRSVSGNWAVFSQINASNYKVNYLQTTAASSSGVYGGSGTGLYSQPTSSAVYLDDAGYVNGSGFTYAMYLFASCPGVSKVGSYTGNGSTQTINCGFTGGARFVLIKRTDSTGDWYVYDTARGMTTLTDPYLLLNSTAAESATLGSVTTVTTGFALNAAILAAINTNGASYIFLAIA